MTTWRQTREYRLWKVGVIRRDKACVVCGTRNNRQAHHLNSASYFEGERVDVENGVCLCKDCHTNFHTNFKRSFREKCTKYDFNNFLSLVTYIKGSVCSDTET